MRNKIYLLFIIALIFDGGCGTNDSSDIMPTADIIASAPHETPVSEDTTPQNSTPPTSEYTAPQNSAPPTPEDNAPQNSAPPVFEYQIHSELFEDIGPGEERYFEEAENVPYTKVVEEKEISIEYPQISGLNDEEIQSRVNELIKEAAFETYNESLAESFDDIISIHDSYKGIYPNIQSVKYEIVYQNGSVLSIYFSSQFYRGGSHGALLDFAINIDLKTGRRINISELFDNSFTGKVTRTVFYDSVVETSEHVNQMIIAHKDWFIDSDDNFYFAEDGFCILIRIVRGIHPFKASYDDLKDCMKSDNPIWDIILD